MRSNGKPPTDGAWFKSSSQSDSKTCDVRARLRVQALRITILDCSLNPELNLLTFYLEVWPPTELPEQCLLYSRNRADLVNLSTFCAVNCTECTVLLPSDQGTMVGSDKQVAGRLRDIAASRTESIADLATTICRIPAPTGQEAERSDYVFSVFEELGYQPVQDEIGNVFVQRGSRGGPLTLVAAHLDTVFPAGTPLTVLRDGDFLRGPAIGDNSLGVAAMIEAIRILDQQKIETKTDIIFVADVGEEGLGNLVGIRSAVDRFEHDLGAVIAVEGHNLGRITIGAVGSHRIEIVVKTSGGHSWGAFGQPSAIHGLAGIVSEIASLRVPDNPRTTYNVGLISGGTSINTIASEASCQVDMRSTDAKALSHLVQQVESIVWRSSRNGLRAEIRLLGERPAGETPKSHPIVDVAAAALRAEGYEPKFDASSTDANLPMSKGIPAVCIGITHGGNGHTVDEYISVPPIAAGVTQLLHLCVNVPRLF